jgi:putative endonuclease
MGISERKLWFLYILKSETAKRTYVGITTDPWRRINEHNAGTGARSTRPWKGTWKLLYVELISSGTRSEATRREIQVKRLAKVDRLALADRLLGDCRECGGVPEVVVLEGQGYLRRCRSCMVV